MKTIVYFDKDISVEEMTILMKVRYRKKAENRKEEGNGISKDN